MAAFEAKLAGNAAFKQGKLELALSSYSTAIKLDPHEAVYYLNRSAVYLKLLRWSDVEKDTTQAIQLDPKLTMKAAFRRGIARREAGDLRAREDFKLALEAGAAAADVHAEVSKIPKKVAAKSKPLPIAKPVPATKSTNPSPSTARLRAALTPSVTPSTSPDALSAATKKSIPNDDSNEFMKASSSRRFDKAATPTTMPESNGFAAKKEKRNERIGGTVGDFRRNGVQENAVVTPPVVPQLIPPTPAVVKAPFHTVPTPSPTLSTQIPISALDFESRWSQLSTPTLRRDYLRNLIIAEVDLEQMFGDCLSPEIVEEIIRCLTIDSAGSLWTFQLLKGLTRVRRFGVAIQFLEEPDRAVIRTIFENARREIDLVAKSWES